MLRCAETGHGAVRVLSVAGRLDLAGAVTVRTALHKTLAGNPAVIVVDLAGLVVVDDVTLTVFPAFAQFAVDGAGCVTLLSVPDPLVRAGLARMGITRTVAVHHDRAGALAAAAAIPPPHRFRGRLAATPAALAVARDLVGTACRTWGLAELAEDAELIVTELVGNVVRHVGGSLEVQVTRRERYLHLTVRDQGRTRPVRILPDPDTGEGGRGLLLVDAAAAGWGTIDAPDGKIVWATVRVGR